MRRNDTPDGWLVRHFRRITSSGDFLPEIDGLRFLAIAMVVVYHANLFLTTRSEVFRLPGSGGWLYASVLSPVFTSGQQGVQLFFVISGFILSLPFTRANLGLGPRPSYGRYLKRRLTRLEPPYALACLCFFLGAVFVERRFATTQLWPSFLASLSYTHNLRFPGELPRINPVFWSLEVEVQYYLIAPAICWLYFRTGSPILRRVVTLVLVGLWSSCAGAFGSLTFLKYGYFFLTGLVLSDFFCSRGADATLARRDTAAALGIPLLVALLWVNFSTTGNKLLIFAFPYVIFAFFLVVLNTAAWRSVFSRTLPAVIGGMCYSIYMIHYGVIVATGRWTLSVASKAGFWPYLLIQMVLQILAVLLVSGIFFKTIERPCMRRDWPGRLWARIRPG
jgi:peptidoglycan/LPS O-acetylase OafA/YrhL